MIRMVFFSGLLLLGLACDSNEKKDRHSSTEVVELQKTNEESKDYRLIAHRGGIVEGLFNEFDPRSIQAAIDSGYYMLEIDVRESKDGVLFVHHDDDFKRFFDNEHRADDLTWEEIQELRSDKGDYHPQSFEQVAQLCAGKVSMMIDVKSRPPSNEYFEKLENIMEKYQLLSGAYFINKEARNYFWDKARFEFRVNELDHIIEEFDRGEDIASNYFLFDHGNRLTAEAVKFCQTNNIPVVVSVNTGHYLYEDHLEGARRDIEYWKACGVTEFQIDSEYDQWFLTR